MIKKFFKLNPIHKRIVKYLDIIFLLRPTLFFAIWVMISIGMYCLEIQVNIDPVWLINFSWNTFLVFIGVTMTCSSTFILNQIADIDGDKINKKLFLVGKYFSINTSLMISNILGILGIFISLLIDWKICIMNILIYYIWGILYNKKPYNFKKKPLLGWLANIAAGILLFIIGFLISLEHYSASNVKYNLYIIIKSMIPYLLCFASVSLLTNIPDINGDLKSGYKTFPIKYGKMTTIWISVLLVFLAFTISLNNKDPLASTSIVVSIPFFIFMAFRTYPKDIIRSIRYPIFIINFFILIIFPLLFFPLMIIFWISKYYYWHRFNLHYPTFLVDND